MDWIKRKPLRLSEFNYAAPGVYFITICTHQHKCTLGEVCRGGALLRPFGRICAAEIRALQQRFNVRVEKYVIMPNHLHLLLSVGEVKTEPARAEQSPAPTTISDMICAFKSVTAKLINQEEQTPGRNCWQRSFYDHVVRNEQEYLKIWEYIEENPLKWELDRFYEEQESVL